MNKVVIIGRVCKEPELKFTPGAGTAVTTLTVACDRYKKGECDFIPVVIWGKQAESTATYTQKGKLIAVAGRIQVRNYDAKDGSKRYVTEVIAEDVQFLEWADKPEDNNNIDNNNGVTPLDDGETPF